ncbi:MAG: ATP-binding protein [Deltaproteobacteria bacterium]|nr:ATP-binding protein [Deltaproteobacteria bacterium]
MKKSENIRMILPVTIDHLSAIQCFIRELAKRAGLHSKDIDFLQLAVEEAITNVVEHAFLPSEDATFEIVCEHTPIALTVRVRDKGLPFDPRQVKGFEPGADPHDISGPGLGLRLMKSFVDKMVLNNLGREGKEIILTKFIQQKHIEDFLPSERLESFDEAPLKIEKSREKIPFQIQLLQPDQAIEVAQCAYRTYGYTYVMENVYYPDRLVEMTRTGDLHSGVAVSEADQEVMAHSALEFQGRKHGIPEIGMGFTKPIFRGMGCQSALTTFMLEYSRKKQIKGIYAKAVTTHTFSQRSLKKFEFIPCGLLVGHSPPKQFSGMERQLNQRETLVLYYRQMVETPPMKIYFPPSHREFIERIFRRLGIAVEPAPHGTDNHTDFADGHSHLECDVNYRLQLANITIGKCGTDFIRKVNNRIKQLCQKKIESITIYMDMTDPDINSATTHLEKQNCFFAGVFPAYPRPYLILQYLNNVYIDYDQVEIFDGFAREVVDYVKGRDPNLDEVVT